MKKFYLLLSILLLLTTFSYAQDALYKIEFNSNWSSITHPTDYPSSSAHWSPLIGTTHKNAAPFLQLGVLASPGVEQVAETGGTSIITNEINVIIATGNAYEIINGSGLSSGLGTITINDVGVDADFQYITLISMIAPSPDWVAQINNVKLTDATNNWLSSISANVYATDTGTDSGTTYSSANDNTNPAVNISSLENTPPFSDQIVGTFVFTLQQVLLVDENSFQKSITIYPNPNEGQIQINNSGNHILRSAEIFALNGKKVKVFNQINDLNILEFDSVMSGLYFLKLNSDKGSIVQKLIIK
ncbi:MAG: spondin domain-containing protein [Aureibaculum sp.]|nr:spondin domain-containing protein [Aureibaculum sp.]